MFLGNMLRLVCGWAVCILYFFVCPHANAQQEVIAPKSSDPVALGVMQKWLDSFGDDVYHCKWEFDSERFQETAFASGKKIHMEGEWSFSAKFGSSYTIKFGDVEYIIREIEGGNNSVLAFWPQVTSEGQKFKMHLAPRYSYNSAFPGDVGSVRSMFYPCELRTQVLRDQWENALGLKSLDNEKAVISIRPRSKEFVQLLTLQTNNGSQAVNETWEVTKADPNMYRIFHGAEYEMNYSNVRVNNAWLPSEVVYERIQEEGLLGSKSAFETAKWKVVGQYKVDKDTSKFRNIVAPDGTLFYDEATNTSKQVGTWKLEKKAGEKLQENAFAEKLQQLPDTPATATASWYPTGRSNIYLIIGAILVIGFIFLALKTKGFGLRRE